MAATTKQALIEACRRHGLRVTGQRRLIAEVLSASNDHPDIAELHARASRRDPSISLSTIYRTIRQFAELGLIDQHSFDGRKARIEAEHRAHHDQLIDTETGKVIEFASEEIEALQVEIARRLGYELTGHRLELYGRRIGPAKPPQGE